MNALKNIRLKQSNYDLMLEGVERTKYQNTMQTIIHRAADRGYADHGWLKANHSFSFGQWYNPEKIHFGALRVLNDDKVAAGMGFGTHPHDNMEIITIPLKGAVHHKDSMGNDGIVSTGEVQVMSAGTGIMHSEFNGSKTDDLELFQIWIFPNEKDVTPRYDQMAIETTEMRNQFLQLVGPKSSEKGVWIHQEAYIHMAELDAETTLTYALKSPKNGIYMLAVEGELSIDNEQLNLRDAAGISGTSSVDISAKTASKVLVIEVPMNF